MGITSSTCSTRFPRSRPKTTNGMRSDSALPGLFMLLALAGIAIFAVTCSSCATSEAFPFRGEFAYAPSTGQFDVQFKSSK